MYLTIGDYQSIFSIEELITKVRFDRTCWIWKGDYQSKKPSYIFRYDSIMLSIHPVNILAALIMDRKVNLTDRRCRNKNCVNPGHYLVL